MLFAPFFVSFLSKIIHMKSVLSLDISSSVIGWSLIEFDSSKEILKKYGNIKPKKSPNIEEKLKYTEKEITKLIEDTNPDFFAVESYANKFSKGRSTARTIMVLSVFNEFINYLIYKNTGKVSNRFAVVTVRSQISKMIGKKIVSKDEVFDNVKNYFKNYNIVYNRNNNVKKECYDEIDSIAVGLCFINKERNNG